jgi:U3 small nucleolar RNA-associated protein 21
MVGVVRCFTLPSGSVQSNKRVRCVRREYRREIVLILTQNELFVTEDLNEMYKIEHDEIERLFHPHTFINKVVIVLKGGKMVLYNVSSRKEVYAYEPFEAAITAIEQSLVVDVVGIGLENGTIHIFNLRTDRVLFSFKLQNAVKELSLGGGRLMAITR